jgi:hypothetical protein
MSGHEALGLEHAILRAGGEDYLDLSYLTFLAEEHLDTRDPAEVRPALLEALRRLLIGGHLRAGDLEPPGEFKSWSVAPDEAYERVEEELNQVAGSPQVGEVAWFEVSESP